MKQKLLRSRTDLEDETDVSLPSVPLPLSPLDQDILELFIHHENTASVEKPKPHVSVPTIPVLPVCISCVACLYHLCCLCITCVCHQCCLYVSHVYLSFVGCRDRVPSSDLIYSSVD